VSVSDTGIGISTSAAKHLFEKFNQADKATTRNYGGTGLGLAISKQLVEMMGGKIWVESELEKGSTFSFTFPYRLQTEWGKSLTASHAFTDSRSLKILLVDDSEDNRLLIQT